MLRSDLRRKALRAATFLEQQATTWERGLAKRLRRVLDTANGEAAERIQALLRRSDIVRVQAHIKYIEWTLAAWSESKDNGGKRVASGLRRQLPSFRAYERMLVELIEYANSSSD